MFEDLTVAQKILIFRGLKSLIEMNSGIGFHNEDQGHPIYLEGADGVAFFPEDTIGDPDGPRQNELFVLLRSLSADLGRFDCAQYNWWYDFDSWRSFCTLAYESYRKQRPA